MPLGFERLNERVQRPNKNINFIKPLEGPDKAIAQDILERVAAIVYPIMKKNHLYVMALEEFPPNREFWGRNFNAGEVIQLVLKSPHNGMWLPIPMIQAVMLHELAHNKEMVRIHTGRPQYVEILQRLIEFTRQNHSRRFHKHRLGYVSELAELKGKGYTGEGFWGKGKSLHPSADLTGDRQIPKEELPEDLCGGVYRRVKKKRDPKKKIDYQEQKKRRIIKKFGSLEGNAVGGDDDLRQKLEGGRKPKGKPRVASSARGRDLRAEAALKRFETQKKEEEPKKEDDSETESESEDDGDGELVKLEDDEVDMNAMMEEMSALACGRSQALESSKDAFPEIGDIDDVSTAPGTNSSSTRSDSLGDLDSVRARKRKKEPAVIILSDDEDEDDRQHRTKDKSNKLPKKPAIDGSKPLQPATSRSSKTSTSQKEQGQLTEPKTSRPDQEEKLCSACQMTNDHHAITCIVCSNVLQDDVQSWKCKSESCKDSDSGYRNSTDVSYCGVCGGKR
ncbi:hypothetical protein TWF281_001016 [Arthrobotrys megalospora]